MHKDAKKHAVTLLFEDKYSLEDIGVMDRQALVISEELTDYSKKIIEEQVKTQPPEQNKDISHTMASLSP